MSHQHLWLVAASLLFSTAAYAAEDEIQLQCRGGKIMQLQLEKIGIVSRLQFSFAAAAESQTISAGQCSLKQKPENSEQSAEPLPAGVITLWSCAIDFSLQRKRQQWSQPEYEITFTAVGMRRIQCDRSRPSNSNSRGLDYSGNWKALLNAIESETVFSVSVISTQPGYWEISNLEL
jgi:hypothetical protein